MLAQADVAHELLTPSVALDRWPMCTFTTDVLWHSAAGVIDSEGAVEAMVKAATAQGAAHFNGWDVATIERSATGYRLTSSDAQVIEAGSVIVCAGGWLSRLVERLPLPAGFVSKLKTVQVHQEQAYHFPYRRALAREEEWPTFPYIRRHPIVRLARRSRCRVCWSKDS